MFERHDRARFETIGVSFGPDSRDPMRARLRAAFDRFVDVRDATDGAVAELLRAMEVDIAVDLKGYTYDSRPAIFALRPAPIHVNYLGFPGTMGAPWMDYLIADDVIVPPEARQWYSERVVWLPDTYQANDNTREIAPETPSRADEGLPESGFVFCSFNNSYKITPPVFDAWMRLLQARGRQRAVAARRQSSGARQPAPRGGRPRRGAGAPDLRAAPQAAVSISRGTGSPTSFSTRCRCNAHTTASDALWAGLPVLTCLGDTFAGRVAGSLLRAAGLPELATASLPDYEALALALARDPERLAGLRARLAARTRVLPAVRYRPASPPPRGRLRRDVGAAAARRLAGRVRGAGPSVGGWRAPARPRPHPRSSSRASR